MRVVATPPGQSQPSQSSPSLELDNSRTLRKPRDLGNCWAMPSWLGSTDGTQTYRDKRTSRQSHGETGTRSEPPPDQCSFTQVDSHFLDALSCPSPKSLLLRLSFILELSVVGITEPSPSAYPVPLESSPFPSPNL